MRHLAIFDAIGMIAMVLSSEKFSMLSVHFYCSSSWVLIPRHIVVSWSRYIGTRETSRLADVKVLLDLFDIVADFLFGKYMFVN